MEHVTGSNGACDRKLPIAKLNNFYFPANEIVVINPQVTNVIYIWSTHS